MKILLLLLISFNLYSWDAKPVEIDRQDVKNGLQVNRPYEMDEYEICTIVQKHTHEECVKKLEGGGNDK